MTGCPAGTNGETDPWRVDWRQGMPRGVLDPHGPSGEVIETATDRRMLWHIESELAISATNDTLRDLGRRLRAYLGETCEHHWTSYAGDVDIPAHRQCLWCSDVEWSS